MAKQRATAVVKTLVLAGVIAAPMAWSGESIRVVYQGDQAARAVCMSIARDDVADLRRAFRNARSHPLEKSHLAYECNELPLNDFALTMDAENVSEYLAPMFGTWGRVTVEQVGSIND